MDSQEQTNENGIPAKWVLIGFVLVSSALLLLSISVGATVGFIGAKYFVQRNPCTGHPLCYIMDYAFVVFCGVSPGTLVGLAAGLLLVRRLNRWTKARLAADREPGIE